MLTPIIRIAAAALVAGVFVFLTAVAPKANVPDDQCASVSVKGDRLPLPLKGTACSRQGWPDFEQTCQFDLRNPAGEARTVRVVALR